MKKKFEPLKSILDTSESSVENFEGKKSLDEAEFNETTRAADNLDNQSIKKVDRSSVVSKI